MTAEEFAAARTALGLTQQQVADALDLGKDGRRTVGRWERGARPVNPQAAAYIRLLRCHLALLSGLGAYIAEHGRNGRLIPLKRLYNQALTTREV